MTYTPDEIAAGNAELLKLAAVLDTADELHKQRGEPGYSQLAFEHDCGTPACAVGHWRAHMGRSIAFRGNVKIECLEFAITVDDWGDGEGGEWDELFGMKGCGRAQTATQAASYIRAFVAHREAELARAPGNNEDKPNE